MAPQTPRLRSSAKIGLVVDDPSAFTLAALGKAESEGLELDVRPRSKACPFGCPMRTLMRRPERLMILTLAGRTVFSMCKHQANLQLARLLTIAGRPLQLGGGLLYVGERLGYFGTDFELPDYTVLRAFAAYEALATLGAQSF